MDEGQRMAASLRSRGPGVKRPVPFLLLSLSLLTAAESAKVNFEIVYAATIKNIPESARRFRAWVPYPRSDDYQQIYSIRTASPFPTYIYDEPRFGNSFLYLEAENPNLSEIKIEMGILASRIEEIHTIDPRLVGELSEEERDRFEHYFVSNLSAAARKRIREIAQQEIDSSLSYFDKVKTIFDYVYDNMEYRKDIPGYGEGDVERACRVKSGNCIDFHSLFVALAQEAGIVATEVANIDLPFEEGIPNYCSASYHCNVEVYLPNVGWIPLDISHAKKGRGTKEFYFGSLDNLRLKLGRGRNIELVPRQDGKRLERLLHRPYVEIDGKVHPDVEVTVLASTYRGNSGYARRPHLIAAGERAERFKWQDIHGNAINLDDFLGTKAVLINFFSTWCGRCLWETASLEKVHADFNDLAVIRINLMEKKEKVARFVREFNIPYPVLPDERGELAKLYGIKYVPTNIVIDKNGIVQFSGGFLTEEDLRKHLRRVVDKGIQM